MHQLHWVMSEHRCLNYVRIFVTFWYLRFVGLVQCFTSNSLQLGDVLSELSLVLRHPVLQEFGGGVASGLFISYSSVSKKLGDVLFL